jgi:hypothetical protein
MTATTTTIRPVEVGDIFASSWGYDQTNVDFYEVVAVTPSGKSVRLVPIGKEVVIDSGPYTEVKAVPGSASPDAKPITKRVRYYGGSEPLVSLTSYSNAWRIDPNEAKYETGFGYGR